MNVLTTFVRRILGAGLYPQPVGQDLPDPVARVNPPVVANPVGAPTLEPTPKPSQEQ